MRVACLLGGVLFPRQERSVRSPPENDRTLRVIAINLDRKTKSNGSKKRGCALEILFLASKWNLPVRGACGEAVDENL